MKHFFFLIIVFCVSSGIISCKSKKAVATSEGSQQVPASDTTAVNYRLIVSFLSKGAGTDAVKRTVFLNFVDQHAKKPLYKTVLWGREGETDYCLTLQELSGHEQTLFVDDVKKLMAGSDLVLLSENTETKHKSR